MTRIQAVIVATFLALPAAAEDKAALYGQILDTAMQDMRVFITCTVLERESNDFMLKGWQETVAETLTFLAEEGVTPPNLAAFKASAQPDALVPAPDTPISEVIAFCDANPDWIRKLQNFDYTRLPYALEQATAP
jgi:hypothetical protein